MSSRLRILLVGNPETGGDYFNEFKDSIATHADVTCSFDEFWLCRNSYDVIHLHWPEYLFLWREPTPIELLLFEKALNHWKENARIVHTRHNSIPHETQGTLYKTVYQLVYDHAHGIIHLGNHSLKEYVSGMGDSVANQSNVVILHPTYSRYDRREDKYDSRKILGIPRNKYVMLVFGKLRSDEEKRLVLRAFKLLRKKYKYLIVTRWNGFIRPSGRKQPFRFLIWSMERNRLNFDRRIRLQNAFLEPTQIARYFAACDFVFVPRTGSLNSGVVPAAYQFSRPVIGPGINNIKEYLVNARNPYYLPSDPGSIRRAFDDVLGNEKEIGESGKIYSLQHLDPESIAMHHMAFYDGLVHG